MKYISAFFGVSIIFFIFVGLACTQAPLSQPDASTGPRQERVDTIDTALPIKPIVDETDANTIVGEWRYAFAAEGQDMGVIRVTLSIESDTNDISGNTIRGTFLALQEQLGIAQYIDTGTFTGTKKGENEDYTILWHGDRQDSGTAALVLDEHRLNSITTIDTSDGLFTLPQEMQLYRVMTSELTEEDRDQITNLVNIYYQENFSMEVTSTIEYIAGTAEVSIQPKISVTEPAYMYMKKQDGVWQSIFGPELYLTEEQAAEEAIPWIFIY